MHRLQKMRLWFFKFPQIFSIQIMLSRLHSSNQEVQTLAQYNGPPIVGNVKYPLLVELVMIMWQKSFKKVAAFVKNLKRV